MSDALKLHRSTEPIACCFPERPEAEYHHRLPPACADSGPTSGRPGLPHPARVCTHTANPALAGAADATARADGPGQI